MIRSSRRSARLAVATVFSLGLLWTTGSAALGAPPPTAPGGTIYFVRVSDPSGAYAVEPNGNGLRQVTCDGDRTHGGAPRRVLRVEQTGATFHRLSWGGLVDEPAVRLVSTDESCGDVRVLWAPGPGYRLLFPAWSIDGSRVALDVQRYDATGQLLDQGIWVGDLDATGGPLDSLHLAVAQPMDPVDPQPAGLPEGMVAYYDAVPFMSWSSDARRVTYSGAADPAAADSPSAIIVADLGAAGTTTPGTARRVVVSGSAAQLYPAFSPVLGDDRIAYVETTSRKSCIHNDIFTVPSTGGTPRQVTTSKNASDCQLMQPQWSPDGRWLTYGAASMSLSGIGIWYIAADGSGKAVSVVTATGGVWFAGPRWRR
jgi:hypothetical protein